MVAIGRPEEELPELGASRLYCENGDWQQTVIELMKASQFILIRASNSAGLIWELKTALSLLEPDRIAIDLCPDGLLPPEILSQLPIPPSTSMKRADFLYFDSNWRPKSSEYLVEILKEKRLCTDLTVDVLRDLPFYLAFVAIVLATAFSISCGLILTTFFSFAATQARFPFPSRALSYRHC